MNDILKVEFRKEVIKGKEKKIMKNCGVYGWGWGVGCVCEGGPTVRGCGPWVGEVDIRKMMGFTRRVDLHSVKFIPP